MTIGVLAVQGDFAKHQAMLLRLGVQAPLVRVPAHLKTCDGLVIPGGESTTFNKLMRANGLWDALKFFASAKAIFGTCAGLVILARRILNQPVGTLSLVDIDVQRNAYGRQRESFVAPVQIDLEGERGEFEGVFIRAPKIARVGNSVAVLGSRNGQAELVRSGNVLAATFHPELTDDVRIHEYFLKMAAEAGS